MVLTFFCGMATASADFTLERAESDFAGKHYVCVITISCLTNAPEWDPEKTPPPLSSRKAIKLAESAVCTQLGNHPQMPIIYPAWHGFKVALIRSGKPFGKELWYYRVEVHPVVTGSNSYPPVTVFVTMNGKVMPLTEQKTP